MGSMNFELQDQLYDSVSVPSSHVSRTLFFSTYLNNQPPKTPLLRGCDYREDRQGDNSNCCHPDRTPGSESGFVFQTSDLRRSTGCT